jgi:hypothetical protein
LRLVSDLTIEQSEEWLTGRRYLNMQELEEHCGQEELEGEEAVLTER